MHLNLTIALRPLLQIVNCCALNNMNFEMIVLLATMSKLDFSSKHDHAGIFCVPQGPFMGPCTNAKHPIFSQLDPKFPNQKINLVLFNNYSIFFHLDLFSYDLKSNDI